jgi:hypothetical protein
MRERRPRQAGRFQASIHFRYLCTDADIHDLCGAAWDYRPESMSEDGNDEFLT